jgi:hypothetical protein
MDSGGSPTEVQLDPESGIMHQIIKAKDDGYVW